jgi:hypothetical protein
MSAPTGQQRRVLAEAKREIDAVEKDAGVAPVKGVAPQR